MARLAQIKLAAAPACPTCRRPVVDLPLDDGPTGEHQCSFCGNAMRIPEAIRQRLIEQRDQARAAEAAEKRSPWWRLLEQLRRLFGWRG